MINKHTTRSVNLNILLLFFVSLLIVIGCSDQSGDQTSIDENRPISVPQEAFLVGGAEGGVYIAIKDIQEREKGIYYMEVYYDNSGELWYRGRATLQPKPDPELDLNDQQQFDGWDGENLYLRDGRYLKAIDTSDTQ